MIVGIRLPRQLRHTFFGALEFVFLVPAIPEVLPVRDLAECTLRRGHLGGEDYDPAWARAVCIGMPWMTINST